MLRFNFLLDFLFQLLLNYFNTSYVTVQRFFWKSHKNTIIISIHPMLRFNHEHVKLYIDTFFDFNTSYVTVQRFLSNLLDKHLSVFQYILCYGSTFSQAVKAHHELNFNTSYVTVQPLVLCDLYFLSYRKTIDTTSVYKNFSNDRHFFQKRTKNRL